MKNNHLHFLLSLVLALLLLPGYALAEPREITSIEVSSIGDYEYVNIRTTGWLTPSHTYYSKPHRLVLVFSGATVPTPISVDGKNGSVIESIRAETKSENPPEAEVIIRYKENVKYYIANMMGKNKTMVECVGAGEEDDDEVEAEVEDEEETDVVEEIREEPVEVVSAIPDLKKAGKFKIILNGQEFKSGGPLFSNGALLVPARHFFEALDSQVSFSKDNRLTVWLGEDRKIDYFIGSKVAKVNGKDFELAAAPVLIKKFTRKVAYVPLISTASMMNYGVAWSEKDKTLIVDPVFKGVIFTEKPPSSILSFLFSEGLDRERVIIRPSGNFITVEADDVLVSSDVSDSFSVGRGGVKDIKIEKKGDRQVIATITLDAEKPYRSFFSEEGRDLSIVFSTAIKDIKPIKGKGWTKIEVFPDSAVTFEVSRENNPERVILDFPGTIFTTSSQIDASDDVISGARMSQYSFDPPMTRMVVTLSHKAKVKTFLSSDGKKVSVVVVWPENISKISRPKKYNILKGKIIVIEPGHGGRDPGGVSYSGIYEKRATLPLALKIAQVLEQAGATVLLTREKDIKVPRKEVVRFANNNNADIFISVHYNSFKSRYMSGTETYYYTPQSRLLAQVLHRNLVNGIKRKDRGIRHVMYYTIHHTTMPAVLVEPGFITNPTEEKLAFKTSFQREVAFDILKGVVEYFTIVQKYRRK